MLRVGLTGGIGAGKSTVAGHLARLGAIVVDADRIAREVVEPGTEGLAAVVEAFGTQVLDASGALDRSALGRLVFADERARLRLNGVLHPRIAALTLVRVQQAGPDAVLVHDVPLLVENRMGADYHLVLVVDAPVEVRVARLVGRGLTEADARARIRSQADGAARRAAADVWLDNSGPPAHMLAQIDALWADRLLPFAENLRLHRAAPRPDPVPSRDRDPGWAAQAARLAERVLRAAGAPALRVDHVGPTAVPILPGEDVLDLQLVVTDLTAADDARAALEDAGFIRAEGRGRDRLADGSEAEKYLHTEADPARPVNLHARPAQGPAWQETLAARDRMRRARG